MRLANQASYKSLNVNFSPVKESITVPTDPIEVQMNS